MDAHTPTNRKAKAIRLNYREKWAVASYCVENKCVMIDEVGKFTSFRMFLKQIASEINSNDIVVVPINEHHVRDSMKFFNDITHMTGHMPKIPVQENVQDTILKEENARLRIVIEQRETQLQKLNEYLHMQGVTCRQIADNIEVRLMKLQGKNVPER